MAVKKSTDRFANIASVAVTESASNTFTSRKYDFPFSIQDKMALIISRIEYWWDGLPNLGASGDRSVAGLAAASSLVDITDQSDPSLIDSTRVLRLDHGTAGSAILVWQPMIKDFSDLPGGGILVAPSPLYAVIKSTNADAAMSCIVKLFYTYTELSTDEYWQLVESRRIISS